MAKTKEYDLIVIGGGSGGYAAAKAGLKKELKVAVIESAEKLGGLCILRGCMPTKTLIETSNRLRAIEEADEFGIEASPGSLDVQALRDRRTRLIDGFKEYRVKGLKNGDFDLYRGSAKFTDSHHISVATEEGQFNLEGKAFVVATGSQHSIPSIDGLEGTPYWTSDEIVELPSVPKSVVVMGTGAVGLESAFLFQGFGSKVTVLSRSKPLLTHMEPEISEAMMKRCQDLGIDVYFGCEAQAVSHSGQKFTLHMTPNEDGEERTIEGEQLVMATGRQPRIEELDLTKAGYPEDIERLEIDKYCQTEVRHIFAAGDCASPLPILHLAVLQGEAAGSNAAQFLQNPDEDFAKSWDERLSMIGIFTDPELVQIGMTEEEAKENGCEVVSETYPYNDQGRGEIVGEKHGLVKLLAEKKTGKILGCSGMGPHVIDYAHTIMVALHQNLTVKEFVSIPSYHPTLGEIWAYVAEDLLEKLDE